MREVYTAFCGVPALSAGADQARSPGPGEEIQPSAAHWLVLLGKCVYLMLGLTHSFLLHPTADSSWAEERPGLSGHPLPGHFKVGPPVFSVH